MRTRQRARAADGSSTPQSLTAKPTATATTTVKKIALQNWDELQSWQQDNEYITGGYRPLSGSYYRSWTSWGYLHNQTVNIYSHVIGAVVFGVICHVLYRELGARYPSATTTDLVVFGTFFLGAAICLTLSSAYHTFANHSYEIYHSWLFMDYMGILSLIMGSFYPGVYYGFFCEPVPAWSYWIMITLIGSGCVVACSVPKFRTPQWRAARATIFVSMALSGILPMTHEVLLFGLAQARRQMGWSWYILEAVLYISGAVLYASRFPERLNPGKYNIWGSSHQLLHIMVLLGAASHLMGMVIGFDYNHNPATRRC